MKNFNLALFLGCCVISIGIVIAGILISTNMPRTPTIPGSFNINDGDGAIGFGDYISEYEAAVFLKLEHEKLTALMNDGKLYGTYTVLEGHSIFSKEKLSLWLDERIAG